MKKDIIFALPSEALEGATEAVVLGDFNNWTPGKEFQLKKQADGSFKTIIKLEEGETYHYRFLLDNNRWVNDYKAQQYAAVTGLHIDNCVITVPETTENEVSKTPQTVAKKTIAKADKAPAPKAEATKTIKATVAKASATKSEKAKPATEKVKAKTTEKKKTSDKAK